MTRPAPNKSRAPMAIAVVALILAGFALGILWQSQAGRGSSSPAAEPDLSSIRESLHREAATRLGTALEPRSLNVTLKPGTLEKAQQTLRDKACLPLAEDGTKWLFQGTEAEAKSLEQTLEPLGKVEGDGESGGKDLLMNITLIGGHQP